MKKKYYLISLALVAFIGSLFTAYASNYLFDDILNYAVGIENMTLYVSISPIMVAATQILVTLYFLRMYRYPYAYKSTTRLYAILLTVINLVGLVGVILSGTLTYHTFVGDYPFPGFHIVFMIIHILLMGLGVLGIINSSKASEDKEKVKITFGYVMRTIGSFLFIAVIYNRFGTFLISPFFLQYRTLYMTFPFYIWLLVPLYLGAIEVLYRLEIIKKEKLALFAIIGIIANVVLFAYVAIIGIIDTSFISALSQSLPLERLTSKPLEIPLHFLIYLGVGIAIIVEAKRKAK